MSLSIKKKAIKKAVSVVTTIATVVCMSGVASFSSLALADVVDGALIKSNATNPDGTPTLSSLDVYIVKLVGTKKFKRLVLNPTIFDSYGHLNWGDIQTVSQSVMDEYTTSALVRVDTDPDEKVYAMAPDGDVGSKSWVNVTSTEFLGVAGSEDGDSIYTINSTDAGSYSAVGDITTTTELETFYSAGTLPDTEVGDLAVALSADTPAAATLIAGQAVAEFTKVNFTASSEGDVNITTIKVTRGGISADTNLDAVYLYDGTTRLAENTSISSSVVSFTDAGGLFTVPAGETKTIAVKADINSSVGSKTISLSINSALDIVSDASAVSGTFPISGNLMSTLTVLDLATANVASMTSQGTTVDPGTDNFEVLKFKINATNQNTQVEYLKFREVGSVSADDIQNLKLYVSGTQVGSTVDSLDSNYEVAYDFSSDPITINKGSYKWFSLKANVVKGSSKTFKFTIQKTSDLVVKDTNYNAYVVPTVSGSTWTVVEPAAGSTSVSAGSISVKKSATSPTEDIVLAGTGVSLAKYDFKAVGENVKVTEATMKVTVTDADAAGSAPTQMINGALYLNDVQIGSTKTIDASEAFTLGSSFIVPASETYVMEVRADVDSNATAEDFATGDDVTITLVSFKGQAVDSLTVLDATENDAANTLTITTGELVASKYASYGNQSVTKGSNDVKVGSFVLKAGSAEGVSVYQITAALYDADGSTALSASTDLTLSELSNLRLSEGTQIVTSPTASNTFGVSFDLAKNETKVVDVFADISSDAVAGDDILVKLSADGTLAVKGTDVAATAVAGQEITVAASSLSVAIASDSPVSTIVVGGADNQIMSKYTFSAVYEPFTVSEVKVTAPAGTDDDFVETWLSYKNEAGDTITTSKQVLDTNRVAYFTGMTMYVASGSDADITVYSKLNNVGTGVADSGDVPKLSITYYKASSASQPSLTVSSGITAASSMLLYKTTPTIGLDGSSAGALAPGENTLYTLKVGADVAGNVNFRRAVFTVTNGLAAGTVGSFKFYRGSTDITSNVTITDNAGNNIKTGGSTLSNAYNNVVIVTLTGTNEEAVTGATDQTYYLKANVSAAATNDTIQVSIADDTSSTLKAKSTNYYIGSATGVADTYILGDSATPASVTVVWYDVDRSGTYTTGDIVLGGSAPTAGTAGYAVAAARIQQGTTAAGSDTSVWYDADGGNTYVAATDIELGNNGTSCADTTAGTVTEIMVAVDGTNITVFYDGASSSTYTTSSNDFVLGNSGSDVATTTSVYNVTDMHFIWSDKSAISHGLGTSDWSTGYLVSDLATDAYTLSK